MATDVQIGGNLTVYGSTYLAGGATLPAASIGDSQVSASSPLGVTKVTHRYVAVYCKPGNATSETEVVHVCKAAGTLTQVRAGSVTAAVGDSTSTIDARKDGTAVLPGTIVLDNANSAYTPESGTVSGGGVSVAVGDVITVVNVASAGTGTLPTGVYCQVVIEEAP